MEDALTQLRHGYFAYDYGEKATSNNAIQLEKDIYAYIQYLCLFRPEFEDGEVVHVGNGIVCDDKDELVESYLVDDKGTVYINGVVSECDLKLDEYERAERADILEIKSHDTQEKLNADALLDPDRYCEKYDLENDPTYFSDEFEDHCKGDEADWSTKVAMSHMLERQRRLDGVQS